MSSNLFADAAIVFSFDVLALCVCFFLNRIWGDFKIVAILPSSLILQCQAEWDGVDFGIGNPGHVFCAMLAFNNFVVFAPLKEILHEVAIRKLHKKTWPLYIYPPSSHWHSDFMLLVSMGHKFFFLLLVCLYLTGSNNF